MVQLFRTYLSIISLSVLFLSFSGKPAQKQDPDSGVFSCYINGRPFVVDSIKACLRKITGGERQLSLNNERFVKFAFLNPSAKNIDLQMANKREAFIRYEDPASSAVGVPVKGFVNIINLDEQNKMLSGEFEMELLVTVNNTSKVVKVTNGRFHNIPIVIK